MILFPREQIENALPSSPSSPPEVAHYTKLGTLPYLFGNSYWSSAWATPVQFLNDRQELKLGLQVLKQEAEKASSSPTITAALDLLLASPGSAATDVYQMSFSGNPDELGQWRGYAANGFGCSLVVKNKDLCPLGDLAGWVIYDGKQQAGFAQAVLSSVATETDADKIEQVLIAAACFMKHRGFEPEMEFRIIKFPDPGDVRFRETSDRIVPYIDLLANSQAKIVPTKLILGPGWALATLDKAQQKQHHVFQGISRLLEVRNLPTSIDFSAIPYDPR